MVSQLLLYRAFQKQNAVLNGLEGQVSSDRGSFDQLVSDIQAFNGQIQAYVVKEQALAVSLKDIQSQLDGLNYDLSQAKSRDGEWQKEFLATTLTLEQKVDANAGALTAFESDVRGELIPRIEDELKVFKDELEKVRVAGEGVYSHKAEGLPPMLIEQPLSQTVTPASFR